MNIKALYKKIFFLCMFPNICWADATYDPCAGLLAVLNRPTIADSVCAVKPGDVVIEMGAQYQELYPESGHAYNLPEALVRLGLQHGNEVSVLLPNYNADYPENQSARFGYTATTVAYKHQFVPIGGFVYGAESLFTLPSGDENFGSEGLGVAINGLISYDTSKTTSIAFMFGYTSETTAKNDQGGQRYNSFNPDLVFIWQPQPSFQFYLEVYGQTKAGPDKSEGYNADGGIQYLITQNIEIDLEYGQRIT
ncbi:MAG: transporter, partial [Gammaproteobacteria bacterium]